MSESAGKAVFLSYASQDAEAAKRIAEALRSGGVEVWFDQDALVGGDAWDQKIRGQIGACALLLPIISANTQGRDEGYFRLEWKLAVDRSHLIAQDKAFLLPVVIDATPDASARVPVEFRAVQWTRLPGGETTTAFVARVQTLLGGPSAPVVTAATVSSQPGAVVPAARSGLPLWVGVTLGVGLLVLGVFVGLRPSVKDAVPGKTGAESKPASAAPAAPVVSDKSIAVLAFDDLSADKGSEYFANGVSEMLLDVLGKVPGLRVSGRTSSFSFKGKNTPGTEIAQSLGVGYLVDGSVTRDGAQVRIAARLTRAADSTLVWSDRFTRELKDIFKLQDEIAGLIANNLSLKLGVSSPVASVNPEVFRLYLEGRQEWNKRHADANDRAEALFEQAVARDPKFARGYAGLADVWNIRAQNTAAGSAERKAHGARAQEHIERTLALDPNLAEPYATRAILLIRDRGNEAEIGEALRRALTLNPNYALAHQYFGSHLSQQGKIPAALAELEIALRLDPLAPSIPGIYGRVLTVSRRWPEAQAAFEHMLAIQSDYSLVLEYRARTLIQLNRRSEALAIIRDQLPRNLVAESATRLTWIGRLAQAGDIEAATKLTEPYLTNPNSYPARAVLTLLLALNRKDDALVFLEKGNFSGGESGVNYTDPVFDAIRDDPRFLRKLEEAGLLKSYREAWSHVPASEKKPSSR